MPKNKWSRRSILKAAGLGASASLFSPFLPSLAGAQGNKRRLVLISFGNGTDIPRWRPQGSENNFELSYILKPLQAYKERLLVLDGIDLSCVLGSGRKGKGHAGYSALWTGNDLNRGPYEHNAGWAKSPSIDYLIGQHLGQQTRYGSVNIGTPKIRLGDAEANGAIAHYRGSDQPIVPELNPRAVFDRFFQDVSGMGNSALEAMRARDKSVLDLVNGRLARMRQQVRGEDKDRLDAHLDGIRKLEQELAAPVSVSSCNRPDAPPGRNYDQLHNANNLPQLTREHFSLTRHLFACDLTRVVAFDWGREASTGTAKFLGGQGYSSFGGIHTTSHDMLNDSGARKRMADLNQWRSKYIKEHLLDPLANTPDGDGTLLDNTLVVCAGALSEGGIHSNRNVPVFMIAGRNFSEFRTGRYLKWGNFDPVGVCNGCGNGSWGGIPHNQLLVSICQAMGLNVDRVGHPDMPTGPLGALR